MADLLRFQHSNSSDDSPLQDGSPFQEDLSDSEHDTNPLEEHDEVAEPLDPRNSQLSLVSLDDRRHHRRSLTHRDFFRQLVDEGNEVKKLRKMFRAAIDRLDSETRRAQEAERRALELAQRFKLVNEARVVAQQEVERTHAELRLYKVQLENAQREISRGSDMLRDIEAQRDSAEAAAARARSTARRLKEEQLMMKAREEGRKEGYQEGLRRGYQQARGPGGLDGQFDPTPAGIGGLGGPAAAAAGGDMDLARTEPLDGLSMLNLQTPTLASMPMGSLVDRGPAAGVDNYGAGAQGSRFREIMATPSTMRSAPMGPGSQTGGWPASQDEEIRYIRPTTVRNAPPSPQHTDYSIPPDGYIPALGPGEVISIPPPHELFRPPSMSSIPPSTVSATDEPRSATVPVVSARDYAYLQPHRGSPRSFADSVPSTTISQFDLVNDGSRGIRERNSGLSAIPEVSSSMEFSPSPDGRVRSVILPDAGLYAGADERMGADGLGNEAPAMVRTRSREMNQRIADELRYSDPEQVEQWRRSSASQSHPSSSRERLYTPHRPQPVSVPSPLGPSASASASGSGLGPPRPQSAHRRSHSAQSPPSDGRPYLGAGGPAHRRTASSTPVSIKIEPPSGPSSNLSPTSVRDREGMLSPDTTRQPLQLPFSQPFSQPIVSTTPVPDRPRSRGYGGGGTHPYGYPDPANPSQYYPPPRTPVAPPSPRHTPEPLRGYPPPYVGAPSSSSSVQQSRPRSRAASADFLGDLPSRSRTPSGQIPSARPTTPGQPGMAYPDAGPVPNVLRSPSRASSRQTLQADPARPSSRADPDRQRTLSMHAGSTPAIVSRPLSSTSQVRRAPSASSINSETSRKSGGYQHYDSTGYIDPAFLASSEDLTSVQSPNTMANTRANSAWTGAGPSRLRAASPSMSYASLRS